MHTFRQKKKPIIYILGYSLFILFWLIVICLSLELFERLRWKHIEKTNKFVRIRRGELLMKEWDEGREEGIHYGEGKTLFTPQQLLVGDEWCLPEPEPLDLWSYRFQIYFNEDETFREAFRTIYDIKQINLNIDKNNFDITCSLTNESVGENNNLPLYQEIIKKIPKDVFQLYRAFLWQETMQEKPYNFFFYPVCDNSENYSFYVFIFPYKGKNDLINPWVGKLTVNDLWDINYFSYIPHINSTESPFRINNFGYRDKDFRVPKPDGVYRILCIGASTTEEGVSNRETYPKFLEQELQKHFGENKIEVFNCGISGMILKKHCAKLPDYLYLQPDFVILYEGINDVIYEVFPRAFDNEPFMTRIALLLSLFARRQMRSVFPYPQEEIDKYINQSIFRYIDYLFHAFLARDINMCISSIGVPYREKLNKEDRDYYDFYYDKEWGWANSTFKEYSDVMKIYNQQLKDYCERNGILYIPVAENIPASTRYFGDICHMRQEGVKLKAKIMADTLIPYLEQVLGHSENVTTSSE
ncbi:MAG: GDSL-type esterase/lipase family protein [Candidatus Hydrogenedens sp.]|nr:GDSL-type esterase/lipase family protein [Candidatus Hydrogenedens sp.]